MKPGKDQMLQIGMANARRVVESAGQEWDGIDILKTVEQAQLAFTKYGVPIAVEEGRGILGKYVGRLYLENESGRFVAYAPSTGVLVAR